MLRTGGFRTALISATASRANWPNTAVEKPDHHAVVQFGAAASDPLAKAHGGPVTVDASKTLSGADALAFGQASKLRRPYISAIRAKAVSNKRVLETVTARKICDTIIGGIVAPQ
jgi:hypothetical protein